MNKFLTKIIGASLAIAMMIGVGINTKKEASLVSAESPASLTFGAACGGSGTDSDGNTWTVTSNASESNFDSARGIHYGTNSASVTYVTLSTNGFTGTINTVVVNASDARGTAVASVTVGETSFTCSGSATVTNSNPGHDYSFTGSATGSIVVDIRRPSSNTKAIYVKSVTVSYTSNGGEEPPVAETCTVTFNYLNGGDPTQITVNKNATIANKMPDDPTKNTDTVNQVKYSFGGWYKSDDPDNISYTSENKVTSATVVTADINVYAKWNTTNYYIITFVTNGGSAVESVEVDEGKKIATPVSTKAGCVLEGWYTTENFAQGTKVDFHNDTYTSNTTLYAKWTTIAIQTKGVFVKVTSTDDLVDEAKYLITYDNSKVFNGYLTTLDATSNYVTGTVVEGKYIKKDDNTAKAYFTITTEEGHKYIKSAQGLYIGLNSNSNSLTANATQSEALRNTISFDASGNVVITGNGGAVLRYNSTSGQNRFRYFKTESYENMQPIQLYKFITFDELTATVSTQAALSYTYNAPVNNPSAFQNVAIRFGGQISKALWNELNGGVDGTNIKGYGVMLTQTDSLVDETIKEDYELIAADQGGFDNAFEEINNVLYVKGTEIKNFYNTVSTSPADDANGSYFWNLYKGINNTELGLTKGFTAVAYINTADGIVFFKETSTSAADLAKALNTANPELDATLDGSLSYLAGLAQNA